MNYQEFRRRLDSTRGEVLALVERVEERLAEGEPPPEAVSLAREFPSLGFSPRVWAVWIGNTEKLQGVRRLDSFPYATHPTRMALVCCWLAEGDAETKDDAAVLALVHDYLEEGDGLTAQGFAAMRQRFPTEATATRGAVLLSEPIIDYHTLGDARELSFWRRVAYVRQARAAVSGKRGRSFADAALADKIDNLHDLDYVALDARLPPDKRATKLIHRIGYFQYVERELGEAASPGLRAILRDGIKCRTDEFGLGTAAVLAEADALAVREARRGSDLDRMIATYQSGFALLHPADD